MNDQFITHIPSQYAAILQASGELGFDMPSDLQTGTLLKTLVASKSPARILELGTGTGLATSWLLAGMDAGSSLVTVDSNENFIHIAKQHLADDRIEFVCEDGYEWITANSTQRFDIIFADAMPGKYDLFEEAWQLLNGNGFYIVDDMLRQPNWPEGHEKRVNDFISVLDKKEDAVITKLHWSTGIIIVVKSKHQSGK